ncbi:MAG: ATPase domain-containing protein [archaeon]
MFEKEPTGIENFDALIDGGIPKNHVVLVSGAPGTGKSIFAQHFIYTGASKYGQKGLYISFEQRVPEIYKQASEIGLDFEKLERQGLVRFIYLDLSWRKFSKDKTMFHVLGEEIANFKPQRIVIDSLSPLSEIPASVDELVEYGYLSELDKLISLPQSSELYIRLRITKLFGMLKDSGATCILTSDIPKQDVWLSRDHVSEFLCDGLIFLKYTNMGGSQRFLSIEKMRGVKHCEEIVPFEITSKGLRILK